MHHRLFCTFIFSIQKYSDGTYFMSVITHLTLNPHNFHYELSYIFTNFLLIFVVVVKVTSTSVAIFV